MTTAQIIVAIAIVCVVAAFLIPLKIWDRRQRAKMTKVERDRDISDMNIW